jgi:GntR family transcriptional regulator
VSTHDLKYLQLRAELLTLIREQFAVGDPLPTERALTTRYGVSRSTVRAAIRDLIEQGVVWRRHGSGTYVSDTRTLGKPLSQLSSFSDDMRSRGFEPGAKVLDARLAESSTSIARDLGLPPGTPVWRVHRLRFVDNEPIMIERVWVPTEVAPGLDSADLSGSLYAILEQRYHLVVQRASQRIRATVLRSDEGELLRLPAGSPAMHIRRVGFSGSGGRAIERADSIYRGDRYEFTLNVTRNAARY